MSYFVKSIFFEGDFDISFCGMELLLDFKNKNENSFEDLVKPLMAVSNLCSLNFFIPLGEFKLFLCSTGVVGVSVRGVSSSKFLELESLSTFLMVSLMSFFLDIQVRRWKSTEGKNF
jgi:hypothetical protein